MSIHKLDTKGTWFSTKRLFNHKVELFLDSHLLPNNDPTTIKIGLVCEPQVITNNANFYMKNYDKYDVILTFDDKILNTCPNAELFEFGSCWVKDYDFETEKRFETSFVVGGKNYTEGHKIRHQVWYNRESILTPKNFYMSSNFALDLKNNYKFLGKKKNELFESMFHIAIENNRSNGYFSEKLIDCLYTKTIPIYWGCTDLHKWFDMNGILVFQTLEELISILNNLTPELYYKLKESVELNHIKSLQFLDYESRVCDKIEDIIKRQKN